MNQLDGIHTKFPEGQTEVAALLSALKTVLKSDDFKVTAKKVFENCAELIGAKAGYVALLSEGGSENKLLFLEDGGNSCHVKPGLPMPIRGLREEAYTSGKVVFNNNFMNSEWVKLMPEGHIKLSNVLFSPLIIDGKTVGVMGFAGKEGDFTEHDAKLAAAFGDYAAIALNNSKTMEALLESNSAMEKLFSIISHDLISPFHALLGYSELLLGEASTSTNKSLKNHAEQIHTTLKTSFDYLQNLLEWSRLQRNKINFNPTQFNLNALIKEVAEVLHLQAENKEISIRLDTSDSIDVFADRDMIRIVLINLVSNAIKFSHFGSEVMVWCKLGKDFNKIYVQDFGIGMSTERCNRLFKIAESRSTPGTNKESGTGLGLVLCYDFIQKHKGKISVKSVENKGSEFCCYVPAHVE